MLIINCDGGSRGNPGPAAYGYVVKKENKIVKEGFAKIGKTTNNVAEYTALIEALKWLKGAYPNESLNFYLDSQLVVSQLNGIFRVKDSKIRDLVFQVRELESNFTHIMYYHVPREQNKEADRLVNLALDSEDL